MDLRNIKLGTLYIVATPIGNPLDITLRAIEVIKAADAVICEDRKTGDKLSKSIGVSVKEWIVINEHNEVRSGDEIQELLLQGKSLALISDCGTPVFSDPGASLIERANGIGARIIPIPGASSLMATLSILDKPLLTFHFAGFPPRQPQEREKMFDHLRRLHIPVVLMDTPYRLGTILKESLKSFGSGRKAVLACDLTLSTESIYRGNLGEIYKQVANKKAEFILIIY